MVARRYEFYVQVARTISHKWAQKTSEILCLSWEHKIHIFKLMCNVLFIKKTYWWQHFWRFSEDFRPLSEDFLKLFQRPDKRSWTFSKDFQRLPKTFEEDPKMFRSYTNKFKYNLRDKLDISEVIDNFTCEEYIHTWGYCIVFIN